MEEKESVIETLRRNVIQKFQYPQLKRKVLSGWIAWAKRQFAGGDGAPSTQLCLEVLQGKRFHHLKCTEIFYTPFPPRNVEVISKCNCVMLECTYVSHELDF